MTPARFTDSQLAACKAALADVTNAAVALRSTGRELIGLCPFHDEKTASFTVNVRDGFYHCFGCGAHGDAIDFVMEVHGLDFAGAVARIAGNGQAKPQRRPGRLGGQQRERANSDRGDGPGRAGGQSDVERRRARAAEIWRGAQPADGTVVETYLRSRGITLDPLPPTLRYHPNLEYWEAGKPSGTWWPVMVAYVQAGNGHFAGIHRTYLTGVGTKAPVAKAKQMLGPLKGGAVRFGPVTERLAAGEGIETSLSIDQALRAEAEAGFVSVWAALSAPGIRFIQIPSDVRELVLLPDHDRECETPGPMYGQAAGEAAAHDAAQRLMGEGRLVRIVAPAEEGADYNDVLVGA